MISLIRGAKGKFPCPICLVPLDELSNLSKDFKLRTTQDMKEIYETAQTLNATGSENLLKEHGLRDVKVCITSLVIKLDFSYTAYLLRMFSGPSTARTSIARFHGIACMLIMGVYFLITCSRSLSE